MPYTMASLLRLIDFTCVCVCLCRNDSAMAKREPDRKHTLMNMINICSTAVVAVVEVK